MNSDLIFALAIALTNGAVFEVNEVTAGKGLVIDWRIVKSGQTILENADAYDVAITLVGLAGWGAVAVALDEMETSS